MMSDLTGIATVLLIVYVVIAFVVAWLLTAEHRLVYALIMGIFWLPLYILGLLIKLIGGLRG
jgi:hypothetical protein